MAKHTIALVFDFDDTLVPDSTTAFLDSRGVDSAEFWAESVRMTKDGWDPVHAFLKLFLDLTRDGGPLAGLTNRDLYEFGSTLKPYQGLPKFFDDVRGVVSSDFPKLDVAVKFWVISGGLYEVIKGCSKISRNLEGFWGCKLAPDEDSEALKHIMRSVSFTEKTRYLFEIHKGLSQDRTDQNPLLVNTNIDDRSRPVPFRNMIYIGDGLTDIPCFSLVTKNGGFAYGVLQKDAQGHPKLRAFEELVVQARVKTLNSPRYGPKGDLGALLKVAVANICSSIELRGSENQA